MAIYFTADTHFGHTNIIKYCNRPFDSIYDMDESILYEINKVVKTTDTLYHLGDFAFHSIKHYIDRINCKKIIFIYGNHDKCNRKELHRLLPCFDIIRTKIYKQDYRSLFHNEDGTIDIVLCHYALAIWEKSHHGSLHLYGHSHSNAEESLDRLMPGRRSMDVGIDNAARLLGCYRPFSFEEIYEILSKKKGYSLDHHE